jgi:hypothetical protein
LTQEVSSGELVSTNHSPSLSSAPHDDGVAGGESEVNSEATGARMDLIGEEKTDPAFWQMCLGSRIVVFDSVRSTEHVAERINVEGGDAWQLFAECGTSSSICSDTDLSNSLVIRGSEGVIRFVRAEENSSASSNPSSKSTEKSSSSAPSGMSDLQSISDIANATTSIEEEGESVIPAYSLRGVGVPFLEILYTNESDQIWNGTSRQEFAGGGGNREWKRLVSPAYQDQGSMFERGPAHKIFTPNAQCPSVSTNAIKNCKYDDSSAQAYIRVRGVLLSHRPDITSLTLSPCTGLMGDTVLKQQGPSTHLRTDAIEANTCRYLQNNAKIAVMGIAVVVQINDINSSPGDNEEKLPSSLWAFGCTINDENECQAAFVSYKSIMTMNDQYGKRLPDFAAQVSAETLAVIHELSYRLLSVPGQFTDETMFFMSKQTGRIPKMLVGSNVMKKQKRKEEEKPVDSEFPKEEEEKRKKKKKSKKSNPSARTKRNALTEGTTLSEEVSADALAIVPHGGTAITVVDGAKKPRGGPLSFSKKTDDVPNIFGSIFPPNIAKSGYAGGVATMFSLIQENASLQTAAQCFEERRASENALRQVYEAKNEALLLRQRSLEEDRLGILKESATRAQELQSASTKSQVEALQRAYEHGSEVLLEHTKHSQLVLGSSPTLSASSTGRRVSLSLDEQLERIVQLRTEASEIRNKAKSIPYPDVQEKLLRKADEKEAEAKALVESM